MLGFLRKKAPATENPSSPKENENKKPVEKKPLSSRQIKKAKRETARQQDKKLRLLKKNTEQQNNDTKRRAKSEAAPKNAVDYIGYKRLFDDGICEVETGLYSITLKISDINYQTARRDEQVDIFSRYCELLNTLEPPLHYQISIVDRSINKDEFMVMFNRYSLKAPNGVILGTPGSGKSFAAKREMINVLLNDPNAEVLIIDPEREYYPIAAGFGGENIHISAGSKNFINPMDITDNYADDDDPLLLKSEFVLTLCELLVGGRQGLTAGQRSIVSRACTLCYQPHFANPAKNPVPTLKDFYEVLKQQPEPEARSLALSMELYIEGSLSVFAHSTNVDTKKRLVVYDIRDLGKQLRTLGMLIVLDQIWNRITQNRAIGKRTWIYIDEIQLLFSNEFSAQYFFELWSRSRKWGAIPTGITQNVETLLLSDLARRMLSNSDFIMMLNQAQPDRVELAGLLNMSSKQLSYVTNTDAGKGLLFAGKSIVPFVDNFPKDNELYQMMTTKIEEVADINRNPATSQSNKE